MSHPGDPEIGVEFQKYEIKLEPIDGTVKVFKEPRDPDLRVLEVGNTGIAISTDTSSPETMSSLDFIPEHRQGPYERKIRPMLILGFGLYELYKYAKEHNGDLGIGNSKVTNHTDTHMISIVQRLLSDSGHPDLAYIPKTPNQGYKRIDLHLGELINLPEGDPLVTRLAKLHQQAQGIKVEVRKTIV